jgi:hypothetical protein
VRKRGYGIANGNSAWITRRTKFCDAKLRAKRNTRYLRHAVLGPQSGVLKPRIYGLLPPEMYNFGYYGTSVVQMLNLTEVLDLAGYLWDTLFGG